MGDVLDRTLDRAVSKGWVPVGDVQAIKNKIEQMGSKYGFLADDFATVTHIESYGMNPRAWNGDSRRCAGVIQFCPDAGGDGVTKRIGGRSYNTRSILDMSLLEQLNLVDAYFNEVIRPNKRNNIDLGNLYFYVLYPFGIGAKYSTFPDDQPINNLVGQQASTFYRNGVMTKASVVDGVKRQAEINLGIDIAGGSGQPGDGSTSGSTSGSTDLSIGQNPGGLLGGILGSVGCTEIFPVEFSLEEAVTYTGCFTKLTTAPMGGSSLAYPSPGQRVTGATNFNISDFDPTVPICTGCLGYPFKTNIKITSPFCQRRTSRRSGRVYFHSGTDYGCREGEEVIAVADGTVISPLIGGSGYEPGFVDIQHEKLGGLVSRYAHIIPSVYPGDVVKQGDVIGKVGPYTSGGPHLHLELRKDKGAGGSAGSVEECKTKFLDPALFCRRN